LGSDRSKITGLDSEKKKGKKKRKAITLPFRRGVSVANLFLPPKKGSRHTQAVPPKNGRQPIALSLAYA
jgi:hypothetical protein